MTQTNILLSIVIFLLGAFIVYHMRVHLKVLAEKERFTMFPERNHNSVSQLDLQGNIIYTNPFSRKLLNKLEAGSTDITLIFPDNIKQELSALRESNTVSAEYIYSRGKCILECHIQLIKDFSVFHLYISDITERKNATDLLTYHASYDDLTGLVNRREFERRTEHLIQSAKQNKDAHALCFMDLDQFKVVNDTCGHVAGDELLRQLSAILRNTVRKKDTLARLGGDEFGILMEHCTLDDACRVVKVFHEAVQNYQFLWEGHSFKVGVSMGLVAITDMTANLTEVMKNADSACYIAKDNGRNRTHVYRTEDTEIAKRYGEMQWVTRINQALEESRFCLHAQIIAPLNSMTDTHYELLLRMIDEKGEIILPGAFLPAAERYNLISQLDRWVIGNAFSQLAENPVFLNEINFCSINLSGASITDPEMLNFIITQLNESGINGNKICFEITETAAISNLNLATKFISTLKDYGCLFALDDFGSGLSSFGYLKTMKVDYLKIDGMFIKDIVVDPIDYAMVKSINEIGHVMGVQTIAEFVENDEIKDMLREIGVDYAQGYGVGKPYPLNALLKQSVV